MQVQLCPQKVHMVCLNLGILIWMVFWDILLEAGNKMQFTSILTKPDEKHCSCNQNLIGGSDH